MVNEVFLSDGGTVETCRREGGLGDLYIVELIQAQGRGGGIGQVHLNRCSLRSRGRSAVLPPPPYLELGAETMIYNLFWWCR